VLELRLGRSQENDGTRYLRSLTTTTTTSTTTTTTTTTTAENKENIKDNFLEEHFKFVIDFVTTTTSRTTTTREIVD
jgi:hypothetical protein